MALRARLLKNGAQTYMACLNSVRFSVSIGFIVKQGTAVAGNVQPAIGECTII